MPPRKKLQPRNSDKDRPLSFESVVRTNYEPATKERPDKMTSFLGWNGFILDRGSPEQRIGFTRLKTQRNNRDEYRIGFGIDMVSLVSSLTGGGEEKHGNQREQAGFVLIRTKAARKRLSSRNRIEPLVRDVQRRGRRDADA